MQTHVGARVPFPYSWRRIFDSWRKLLGEFETDESDIAFWYNEPANVTLFAGAIWRSWDTSRCVGEWIVHRGAQGGGRKGKADLWFRAPEFTCDVEAKIRWPTRVGDTRFAGIGTSLKLAHTQLLTTNWASGSDMAVAMCFVVPWLPTATKHPTKEGK